ncbi:MAG: type transport system permease protein [Thermococcaceae archaeon]|nr:type transport system permease protein [Thermococcaceae archaeon]
MDDEEGGQEMKALNIAMKELYVSIKSKRFVIILSIYVLLLLLLSYSLRDNLSELTSPAVENLSMDLFGVSGEVFATPLSTMLTLNFTFFTVIGAILGASLGADAINKEIESGTIKTLLGHPVYRDEVINGKFLGNAFVLAITITIGYVVTIAFLLINGTPLDGDSVFRGFIAFLLTFLYSLVFLSFSILFSTLLKKPETSMLISIGLAIFLTMIYGLIVSLIAQHLAGEVPPYGTPAFEIWEETFKLWKQRLHFINPAHHYVALIIAVFAGDRIANYYTPLGDSLLLMFNNLSMLLTFLLLPFAFAYARFMTSDLR